MTSVNVDPYPWFLNKHLSVTVNDREVATRITATEWREHWRPLLTRIYEEHVKHPRRLMVAIAGPPGSGKSVLAEQLTWVIDKGCLPDCHAVALPMDGFHFSNDYLLAHKRVLHGGLEVPLLEVKGSPDTFDVAGLRQRLQLLRQVPEEAYWPGYSRTRHDVMPDLFRVAAGINVVFVDGNYLLLDKGPFFGIPALFHFTIYVEAEPGAVMSNLMYRHIAGGKTVDVAKEWVKRIDLPNARVAEATRHIADVIVERNSQEDIVALRWKGQAPVTR